MPDLERGVDDLAGRLGVRATPGGSHEGRGTHNALLGLGGRTYLEVIAPDPSQAPPSTARRFGLDLLSRSGLAGWALRPADIDAQVRMARAAGYDPGPVRAMARIRPDGVRLDWRLTSGAGEMDPVLPFLIDWGDTPHPSDGAVPGCTLLEVSVEHPEPDRIRTVLRALGAEVTVRQAPLPALVATLETPAGRILLR